MEKKLPKQFPNMADYERTKGITDSSASSMILSAGANALTNIVMGVALSQVWSLVNGLQVIVHLPLFKSKFPSNSALFMNGVIWIATFEILQEDYVENFVEYPQRDAISDQFE